MKKILVLGLLILQIPVSSALAAISEYKKPEILARANLFDVFNLPELSFLTNNNPEINNRGDVTFKVLSSNGPTEQGIWVKRYDDENGKIYFNGLEERIVSDPSLNNLGQIAFSMGDVGVSDGIFIYDVNTDKLDHKIKGSQDVEFMTYPQITAAGDIFFRATNKANERSFYSFDPNGQLSILASEESSLFDVKTSYLFKLSVNDNGSFAFKRRLGNKGDWDERSKDEIVLVKKNGNKFETVIVAQDSDSDPKSTFKSFVNMVSISDNNMVVFIAELATDQKVIYLYKDGELFPIAADKNDQILEIERFEPRVNSLGQVVFRAKDAQGKRSIFIGEKNALKKIITEGDDILSDKGPARILSNINYPGFSGAPDINDNGDVVFNCILTDPKHGSDWGSAVYKLSPLKK